MFSFLFCNIIDTGIVSENHLNININQGFASIHLLILNQSWKKSSWLTVLATVSVQTVYFPPSPLVLFLILSLDFRSIYSLHFASPTYPQLHFSPSSPALCNEWGSSSRWTEVGLGRSGGGSKGWAGDDREPARRDTRWWMAGRTEGEKQREEEERRRDDGDLSFHFPSVWLFDDEGHYSRKEQPTPPRAALSFFLSFFVCLCSPSICHLSLSPMQFIQFMTYSVHLNKCQQVWVIKYSIIKNNNSKIFIGFQDLLWLLNDPSVDLKYI